MHDDLPFAYCKSQHIMKKQSIEHGYKKLTKSNWNRRDSIFDFFITFDEKNLIISKVTGNDLAERILKFDLLESVPIDLQKQYKVARSILLYGYFFYPLYAAGLEQLLRILEFAVTQKCLETNVNPRLNYKNKLDRLRENNTLSEIEFEEFTHFRRYRNELTHAKMQSIITPDTAIYYLHNVSERINNLFSKADKSE